MNLYFMNFVKVENLIQIIKLFGDKVGYEDKRVRME